MPIPGSIIRMTSYTHVGTDSLRMTYGVENRKEVAVFILLGREAKDGSQPLDVDKAMNDLGWFAKQEDEVK